MVFKSIYYTILPHSKGVFFAKNITGYNLRATNVVVLTTYVNIARDVI